jgi:hypothetical protein
MIVVVGVVVIIVVVEIEINRSYWFALVLGRLAHRTSLHHHLQYYRNII